MTSNNVRYEIYFRDKRSLGEILYDILGEHAPHLSNQVRPCRPWPRHTINAQARIITGQVLEELHSDV